MVPLGCCSPRQISSGTRDDLGKTFRFHLYAPGGVTANLSHGRGERWQATRDWVTCQRRTSNSNRTWQQAQSGLQDLQIILIRHDYNKTTVSFLYTHGSRAIQVRCRLLSACHCMGAPCLFGIQHPQERDRAQQWYTALPQISNIHYDILNRSCNSCPCWVAIHSLAACAQPATPRNRPGAADARSQQLSLKQIKVIRPQNMQHCVMHFCHRKDLCMQLLPRLPSQQGARTHRASPRSPTAHIDRRHVNSMMSSRSTITLGNRGTRTAVAHVAAPRHAIVLPCRAYLEERQPGGGAAPAPTNQLESLRTMSVVVADTGDPELVRKLRPGAW